MSLEEIATAVRFEPVGKYLPMRLLREHHAPYRERLSDGLCDEIDHALVRLGIGHLPWILPTHEVDMVHLFDLKSDLGQVIALARKAVPKASLPVEELRSHFAQGVLALGLGRSLRSVEGSEDWTYVADGP